jgi:hypothetical protein
MAETRGPTLDEAESEKADAHHHKRHWLRYFIPVRFGVARL